MKKTNIFKLLILSLTSMVCFSSCNSNIPIASSQNSSQSTSNVATSSEQISSSSSSESIQSNSSSSSEIISSQQPSSEQISSVPASSIVSSQSSSVISSSQEKPYSNFVSRMDSYIEDTNDALDPDNGGLTSTEVQTIISTISTYYASVDTTYKGQTLWNTLQTITTPTKLVSYGELRYSVKGNPYAEYVNGDKTKLVDFYTGAYINSEWDGGDTWNREHVWCYSHFKSGAKRPSDSTRNGLTDLHHLRPSDPGINSSRNNSLYGEVPNRDTYKKTKNLGGTTYTYGYLTGNLHADGVFEPTDRMKGDVARILLYMVVRYAGEINPITSIVYTSQNTVDSAYQLLLKWHNEDPVSNFEIRRNHRTYEVQGNRNPFIDVPSYADAIFANL